MVLLSGHFVKAFRLLITLDQTQLQGFHSSLQSLPAFYKEHFEMLWKNLFLCPKAPKSEMLQLEAA